MHGAGGGAPKGNRNALKHGDFAAEALALKRQISALARMARETMGAIERDSMLPNTVLFYTCICPRTEASASLSVL